MQFMMKCFSFFLLYFIATFLVIPPLAKYFGRIQLPLTQNNNVRPLNFLTFLFNRNYVTPGLKNALFEVAGEMNRKYPGTIINYLDANFPFINGFSLLPHLSHNDGRKLDISFCYTDNKTGMQTNECPSFIGYGICEEPTKKEQQMAAICKAKGYWQYDLLRSITPQTNKANFLFDADRTKQLIQLFASKNSVEKIFVEPHLKIRMKLNNDKIRFQGCHAVRHDDHMHIQVK
jgi:hypothetical protein